MKKYEIRHILTMEETFEVSIVDGDDCKEQDENGCLGSGNI